jgi:hypothetical protein
MIPGTRCKKYLLDDNVNLITMEINHNSKELTEYVNKLLVSICTGKSGIKLEVVKIDLLKFLERKKDSTIKMGAVAEFFVHVVLNSLGFKQECLFENLEENSIKKGFDGYYSKNNVEWIMESKSGMNISKGVNHVSKLKEAYNDLKGKISGNSENNPWKNAYHHASLMDVNADETIINNIKRMSANYSLQKYDDISNFNVIPAATIFLDNYVDKYYIKDLIPSIKKCTKKFNYKDILVICTTKYSVEILKEILQS